MSSDSNKIYCFDTSAFIQLHTANKIIPIPDLWNEMDALFKAGKIISHEFVWDELNPNSTKPDFIAKWIKDKQQYFQGISDKQIDLVTKILNKYPDLIDVEKERNEADPWIVSLAIEKTEEISLFGKNTVFYVVSQEKISSNKKIPAVCREWHIPHMNLNDFFKDNGWTFGLVKS